MVACLPFCGGRKPAAAGDKYAAHDSDVGSSASQPTQAPTGDRSPAPEKSARRAVGHRSPRLLNALSPQRRSNKAHVEAPLHAVGDMSSLPKVADLVAQHRETLKLVREHPDCAGLLGPEHDDIFLVRYVLSFKGDVAKSAAAVKNCITWRKDNAELLARIEALQAEVRQILPTGILPWRTKEGQPIQVAIPFAVDGKVWSTRNEKWHHEAGISNREVAFRICDQLTRESGHLVKLTIIQDLTGLSLTFVMQNRRLMQNQGKLSKLSEFLYPQMIQTVVITHPPSFAKTLYDIVKAVVSQRLMQKVRLGDTLAKICEEAKLTPDTVPAFLGGSNPWDAEWVPEKVKAHAKPAQVPATVKRV